MEEEEEVERDGIKRVSGGMTGSRRSGGDKETTQADRLAGGGQILWIAG